MPPISDDKIRPYFLDDTPLPDDNYFPEKHLHVSEPENAKPYLSLTKHWLMALLTASILSAILDVLQESSMDLVFNAFIKEGRMHFISTFYFFIFSFLFSLIPFLLIRILMNLCQPLIFGFVSACIIAGTSVIIFVSFGSWTFMAGHYIIYTTIAMFYLFLFVNSWKAQDSVRGNEMADD